MNRVEAISRLLDDGEWHYLGNIVTKIGADIPPEKASRLYLAAKVKRNDAPSLEVQVYKGRERAVRKSLDALVSRGEVEVRTQEGLQSEFRKVGRPKTPYADRLVAFQEALDEYRDSCRAHGPSITEEGRMREHDTRCKVQRLYNDVLTELQERDKKC